MRKNRLNLRPLLRAALLAAGFATASTSAQSASAGSLSIQPLTSDEPGVTRFQLDFTPATTGEFLLEQAPTPDYSLPAQRLGLIDATGGIEAFSTEVPIDRSISGSGAGFFRVTKKPPVYRHLREPLPGRQRWHLYHHRGRL